MSQPGYLFGAGPAGRWDDKVVSCPVVRPSDSGYRMWYYGRDQHFPGGGIEGGGDGIPMGRTGAARSVDGFLWERVDGPGVQGAVLDPSPEPDRFDSWLVGGTDVVERDGSVWLYTMGAGRGAHRIDGELRNGFPLAIGLARSRDGLAFEKVDGPYRGAIVPAGDEGAWDEWFAGWPRILPIPGGWRMYYHGSGPGGSAGVGVAESPDGIRWEKGGRVFGPSGVSGAFDARGVSTRHVIPWQGGYLMAYEALPEQVGPHYRIGLATSADGLAWQRLPGPATGGAVLDHGPGSWDSIAIGTPYLVPVGAELRMYYVGFGPSGGAIGVAVCDVTDLTRWEKVVR